MLLQAALLGAASPAAFLARAPTPPLAADADAATRNLLELGAFAPAAPPPGTNPNRPPPTLLSGGVGGKVQLAATAVLTMTILTITILAMAAERCSAHRLGYMA